MVAELKPVHYEAHPAANIFPMMSEDEFAALVDDIKKHGLREPIWLFDNKIIDGRNRYRACLESGEKPRFKYWMDGAETIVDFVVSQNLHRRHLTASQKAMLGAQIESELAREAKERQRLAAVKTNEQAKSAPAPLVPRLAQAPKPTRNAPARDQAAKLAGAGRQYVSDAKQIIAKAPEVAERVKAGTMEMQDAKAVAALPERQRKTALDVLDNGAAKNGRTAAAMVLRAEPSLVQQTAELPLVDSPQPKPLLDLEGRDPDEFRSATTGLGEIEDLAKFAEETKPAVIVRGAFEEERTDLKNHAAVLIPWLQEIQKELAEYD